MFQWGKSSKNRAAPAAAVGEVPVQKVQKIEKIDVLNFVSPKPGPVRVAGDGAIGNPRRTQPPATSDGAGKPDSPRSDDIDRQAGTFINNTKKRWYLGHKSFRATGRR